MTDTPTFPTAPKEDEGAAKTKPTDASGISTGKKAPVAQAATTESIGTEAIKNLAIFAFTATIAVLLLLNADLDPKNKYFSTFGKPTNTAKTHKKIQKQTKTLESQIAQLSGENAEIQRRIQTEEFFTYQDIVNEIQNNKLNWTDKTDENGKTKYGMIDSILHMKNYLSSPYYKHDIITGNQITIDQIQLTREKAKFAVTGTNIFGKIFFLNTELVKMMNSYAFFKNGAINNFSKKLTTAGDSEMKFSLDLDIQTKEDEDKEDENFIAYQNWKELVNSGELDQKASAPKTGPKVKTTK